MEHFEHPSIYLRFYVNHLPLFSPLYKYCDLNRANESAIPLFAFICKLYDTTIVEKYLPAYNISTIIDGEYNIISYLISQLIVDDPHFNNVHKSLLSILKYMKQNMQKSDIEKILSQFPKKWLCLMDPILTEKNSNGNYVETCRNFSNDLDPIKVFALHPWLPIVDETELHKNIYCPNHDFQINTKHTHILIDIMEILLELGIKFDQCKLTMEKLYELDDLELFKFFVSHKLININATDDFGYTFISRLLLKKDNKSKEYINILLNENEIDLRIPNVLNQTPLLIAMKMLCSKLNHLVDATTPDPVTKKISEQLKTDTPKLKELTLYDCSYAPYQNGVEEIPETEMCHVQGFTSNVLPTFKQNNCSYAMYPNCFEQQETIPKNKKISQTCEKEYQKTLKELIEKMLKLPLINPNTADINGVSLLSLAFDFKDNELTMAIIKSPLFDGNYKYNDGSTPLIQLTQRITSFDVFDPSTEIYLYVLDYILKNKNISLMTADMSNMNALMYAALKDNNVVIKKMLDCNISTTELNNLLNFVTEKKLTININLIKTKINANNSKTGKWLFFF
jgi:hypothetical protein